MKMAAREAKRKRAYICISSSSEEDDERVYDDSDDDDHEDDDEDEQSEDDDEDRNDVLDDESLCNKVIGYLKEGRDLDSLSLVECKAYLRRHGLRISGAKLVCIQRIIEHQRLKDGNGEALYPRSSFVIDCTGDVCKGDVVLFTQKVYKKFDKMSRHGRVIGKRMVAGKVVKESYGAAKQQHTFTVEVLWSRGVKELCPLFPLLVKGRNLYKMKTFRQLWSDEAERSIVLAEKHRRGGAARQVRAMKRSKKFAANGGMKCRSQSHSSKSNKKNKTKESKRGKHEGFANHNSFSQHGASLSTEMSIQQNARSTVSHRSSKRQKAPDLNRERFSALYPQSSPRIYHTSQLEPKQWHSSSSYFCHPTGSTSTILRHPAGGDVVTSFVGPASQFPNFTTNDYSQSGYIDPLYNQDFNQRNQYSGLGAGRPFQPYDFEAGAYGHRGRGQR